MASRGLLLGKRTNWCEAETNLLLDLWSDCGIQLELKNFPRNQPVFDRIARVMMKNGFQRTGAQCREKIKTLKKEYKYAKIAFSLGRNDKNNFRYWDKMEAVLESRNSVVAAKQPLITIPNAGSIHNDALVSDPKVENETPSLEFNASECDVVSEISGDDDPMAEPCASNRVHWDKYFPSKRKLIDTSRLEAVIEAAADKITAVLCETQNRLLEFEEKRMKFEAELEAQRRQESRDHEIKLLTAVGQMFLQALEVLRPKVMSTTENTEITIPKVEIEDQ